MVKMKSATNKSYGTNANKAVNKFGRDLLDDYLKERSYANPEEINVYTMRSLGAIQELIFWNPEANFDRVSALGMLMILRSDRATIEVDMQQEVKTVANDPFWDKPFGGTAKSYKRAHKLLNIPPPRF